MSQLEDAIEANAAVDRDARIDAANKTFGEYNKNVGEVGTLVDKIIDEVEKA
jgi:hypothetical protein